ncbi:hypothetical protein ACHAWX_003716 [Stephanocyclus meneghinianus]
MITTPSWNSDNQGYIGAGFPHNDIFTHGGRGRNNRSAGDRGRCDADENVRRAGIQSIPNQWEQQNQNDHDRRYQNQSSRRETGHLPSHPNQPQQTKQNDPYSQQQTRQHHGGKQQFAVLYTHQKTKKKKSWKDGRLQCVGGRATLYDANPMPGGGDAMLDSTEVSFSEIQRLVNGECTNLESEKYLIQIEGPWTSGESWSAKALPSKMAGSAGMKKVMGKKFQIPSRKMPNFAEQRRLKIEKENKKRRVLQPGELERIYYGGADSFSRNDNRWHGCNYENGNSHSHGGDSGYGSTENGGGFQESLGQSNSNIPSAGRSQYNDFRDNFGQQDHRGADSCFINSRDNNHGADSCFINSRDNNYAAKSSYATRFQHIQKSSPDITRNNSNDVYSKGGDYSSQNNNDAYQDNDTSAYENKRNPLSFGPPDRGFDESRLNCPHPFQDKGARNDGRCQNYYEVNAGSISGEEPQPFQSNELDPSGFYEEEDDDNDDEDADTGWGSNDQVTNIQNKQLNDVNESRVGVGGSTDFNRSHHSFSCKNSNLNEYDLVYAKQGIREPYSNSHPNESQQEQSGSHNQPKSSQVPSKKVCPVTETLNALFGATSSTDKKTFTSHGYGNRSPNVENNRDVSNRESAEPNCIQGNGDINPSKVHKNSFLAGFIEAEKSLNDDASFIGKSSSDYEFNNERCDDIDDQQNHDYGNYDFDGTNFTNVRREGREKNDATTRDAPKELCGVQITGLSLPSAGESSSEEDDSLSGEP